MGGTVSKSKREPQALAEAVPRIVEALARSGYRHALIGGVAVGVWIEPRATKDIDFLVDARSDGVDELVLAARSAGFEAHPDEVQRLRRSHMTRVWTSDSEGEPLMIDLLLNEHPFYESVLDRSRPQQVQRTEIRVASPEDLLILKLLAMRPQDIADAGRLVETYGPQFDRAYLQFWASELSIEAELREALPR
jgi:predicted nucleotidyltransferase